MAGDSGEELLRSASSQPAVKPYPDLDSLVAAAVAGRVRVFVADVPSARFFLSKHEGGGRFRQSPDIASNTQYVGIRKGREELARQIREGFARIDAGELEAIFGEWAGRPAGAGQVRTRGRAGPVRRVPRGPAGCRLESGRCAERCATPLPLSKSSTTPLQRIQEDTRRSEERFRLIFENAPYAITIHRLEDGTLVDGNPAFLESYGIATKAEALGQVSSAFSRQVPDTSEEIVAALRERGSVRDMEARLVRRDGSTRNVLYSSVRMGTGENAEVLSIIVDTTARVRAEEELRRSEDRLRTIFGHVPVGIFRVTLGGDFTDVNPALVRMFGYSGREAFLAETPNLVPLLYASPDERRPVLDRLRQSPQGIRFEVPACRRDGTRIDVVVNASIEFDGEGQPAFISGAIEDLTRQREAENQLRLLAAAVEQSSAITVITSVDGAIEYVNKAFEQSTGYCRDEVFGKNPSILKSGKHDQGFYRHLWSTILDRRPWRGRFYNKRKNGSEYVEDATIFPILGEHGDIVNFVATKRDITVELALEAQHNQMQKMEAIGQLTGGVAHDFNNILQVIQGYSELGLLALDGNHPGHEPMQRVSEAAERASSLVQQLLLFSRQKVMQPKLLDLKDGVDNLLKMLGRLLGEHIEIRWRPCERPVVVFADSGMVDQILMNLCVNARDAMPSGGVLTIETSTATVDDEFAATHPWATSGTFAVLQVSDNGIGMDEKTRERIFEPFFTTKGEGKGTGMGLATVYGIVRQHKGMVDVYSEPGLGSRFRVYLPLQGFSGRDEAAEPPEAPTGGSETILLAEDDADVRRLATTILEMAGYAVLVAEDGLVATELFAEHRDKVGLCVLDVVMPRLGGKDAAGRIMAIRPETPVLFASGYSKDAIHHDFVLKEGVHLIHKPYSRNDLLRTVRSLLDGGDRR